MKKLNSYKKYSISEYKNGLHELNKKICVFSGSGKEIIIKKEECEINSCGIFTIDYHKITRKSKFGIINLLKKI